MKKECEKVLSIERIRECVIREKAENRRIAEHKNEVIQTIRLAQHMRQLHANLVVEANNLDITPMYLAVKKDNLCLITYLLSAEWNINAKDENGWTMLHYATDLGRFNIVKYLIYEGADFSVTDNEGNTPMFYAFEHGDLKLIKYFVEEKLVDPLKTESGLNWTLFERAVSSGKVEAIEYLIDERNVAYDGNKLLEAAISNGHFDVVQYFIEEKGVDVNFVDENGWAPLMAGVERGDIEIVEYLMEKKANINATTKDGSTVLHIAAHDCNSEIVQHLIEKGADVNAKDNKGNTPLHTAVEERKYENKQNKLYVVQYLVNNGADVSAKNNDGQAALNVATNCDVVKYLSSVNK